MTAPLFTRCVLVAAAALAVTSAVLVTVAPAHDAVAGASAAGSALTVSASEATHAVEMWGIFRALLDEEVATINVVADDQEPGAPADAVRQRKVDLAAASQRASALLDAGTKNARGPYSDPKVQAAAKEVFDQIDRFGAAPRDAATLYLINKDAEAAADRFAALVGIY
jgi:hypothetical protein